MNNHHELDSQKYYQHKVAAEANVVRRNHYYEAFKMLILSSIIVTGFTFACIALMNSPEVILNAVESLKAQGLWPF